MGNKGFMMAEVVVVSAIILTFIASTYVSYNKIYSSYKKVINYYDTVTLYRLGYYRDYLNDLEETNNNNLTKQLTTLRENNDNEKISIIDSLSDDDSEKVYLIYNHQTKITVDIINDASINQTFKDYFSYIEESVDLTGTNAVMIMERCLRKNIDNCRYAYLEVNDGYEEIG